MIESERVNAKKKAIKVREQGGDLTDCALQVGISDDTLRNWRKEDSVFSGRIEAAWSTYKTSLIRSVKRDKPEFLLQSDFKKRFAKQDDKNQGNTTNILVINDENLTQYLHGFYKQLESGPTLSENSGESKTDADS